MESGEDEGGQQCVHGRGAAPLGDMGGLCGTCEGAEKITPWLVRNQYETS